MPHLYTVLWEDVDGRKAETRFHAIHDYNAEDTAHDLAGICAASWRELREDGILLAVSSPRYRQLATAAAALEQLATFTLEAADGLQRRHMQLRGVLPSYLNARTKKTSNSPFRESGKVTTEEGVPLTNFVLALFHYRKVNTTRY